MTFDVRLPRAIGLLGALVALPLGEAYAQCADGSPEPCRGVTVAVAPRRVNPPLDDRTWIVVPFDNLRKVPDIDWLRGASVNLLYLDMSRWRDIRVIDDERVADLLREVPSAGAQSPSLGLALGMAKRAGAGKLVMGDLLKMGNRTAVTAKVFDVRTGKRLRSVQETAVEDSVMPLFGKLAQKILDVAPPAGTTLGAAGTTSIDAYQEYLAGVGALSRFDVPEARRRLERALQLDSTFALAHYKMSLALGWGELGGQSPMLRPRAETAERLGIGLPPRERSLIKGQVLHARGDETGACAVYADLVRADSSDVEAWYGLGECEYHNSTIDSIAGNPTRYQFRSSWNASIRAFERVLALDPTYHIAFPHIVDVLVAGRRSVCVRNPATNRCTSVTIETFVRADGDSLVFVPLHSIRDSAALRLQREERLKTESRRKQLARADAVTQRWVFAGPSEFRARSTRANVLHFLGRLREAQAEVVQIRPRGPEEGLQIAMIRMELATKLGEGREAVRLFDSVRASPDANKMPTPAEGMPAGAVMMTPSLVLASNALAFGRVAEQDSFYVRVMANAPPAYLRYMRASLLTAVGAAPDSLAAIESATFGEVSKLGLPSRGPVLLPTFVRGLAVPRESWPGLDTTTRDLKLLPAVALSQRDTARLRQAARALDSVARLHYAGLVADTGFALAAADAYVVLRDSAAALRSLRFMLDTLIAPIQLGFAVPGGSYWHLIPRATLLRADLAAGLGHRDEAKLWYKRFLDLWSTAAPELQPIVERARKSYAAIGGT